MARPLPGLTDVAARTGRHCAFFYNWEQLRNLSQPGSLEFSYCWNIAEKDVVNADQRVADAAAAYIAAERPDFAFVYLGTVDTVGHRTGWMSEEYLAQVGVADQALGTALAALPSSGTVLVQSDHGGHDRSHGTEMAEDMRIPWIVAGPGIRAGHAIAEAVSLLDSAPTLAHVLQLQPHRDWEGRLVTEALVP
jgi:arylsulfatase A-like enzyme